MSGREHDSQRLLAWSYDTALRSADWCLQHRRAMWLGGAPMVTLALVAIGWLVLLRFPNSGDEYAYVYQAETLARGRLWNAAPALPDVFAFNYIAQAAGREYSTFPVGWPLLLALAVAAHVPMWLVNPVLGTTSLWLIATLGGRLHTRRIGVLAAGITLISGFFLFNAASYFSHTFCSVLVLAAACLATRDDRARWWVPAAIGWLLGWAVLARYFTAVVCAIPILVLVLKRRQGVASTLAWCAVGGLPWVIVLAAYNQGLNGSPWHLTTLPSTVGLWFAPKFLGRGADILATQALRFVWWTPPALLFVYVYYLARAVPGVRRGLIDWMPALMAAALYCYIERGGNQYGPRFYYETFPFLVIFTTACVFREDRFAEKSPRDRRIFAVLALSLLVMPLSFLLHAVIEHRVVAERSDPYKMVAAAGVAEAVVLLRNRVGSARSMAARDLTRNGIDHDASVLYGLELDPVTNCDVAAAYPGRALYLYWWDAPNGGGVLQPLPCP